MPVMMSSESFISEAAWLFYVYRLVKTGKNLKNALTISLMLDARTVISCVLKVSQLESVSGSICSKRVDGIWMEEVIGERVN